MACHTMLLLDFFLGGVGLGGDVFFVFFFLRWLKSTPLFFGFKLQDFFSKLVRKEVQVENSKQMLGDLMRGPTNKSV